MVSYDSDFLPFFGNNDTLKIKVFRKGVGNIGKGGYIVRDIMG